MIKIWIKTTFFGFVEIYTFFLNALGGYGQLPPPPRRGGIPSEAIIPEKVIHHSPKAQGRFGGTGTVPSEKYAIYNLVKSYDFQQSDFFPKNGMIPSQQPDYLELPIMYS